MLTPYSLSAAPVAPRHHVQDIIYVHNFLLEIIFPVFGFTRLAYKRGLGSPSRLFALSCDLEARAMVYIPWKTHFHFLRRSERILRSQSCPTMALCAISLPMNLLKKLKRENKPWAVLGMSRREYEVKRPWKGAGVSRDHFEEIKAIVPPEMIERLKEEAQAELLVEQIFGKDVFKE